VESVLPKRMMCDAFAFAKPRAMERPMPWPPPVMSMILPLAESFGREGSMAG
jgi:hypothetical protein